VPTSKRLNVAVVGATGMVGNEMLRVLSQREFPSERVIALASERSKGMTVPYNGSSIQSRSSTSPRSKASTSRCSRQAVTSH